MNAGGSRAPLDLLVVGGGAAGFMAAVSAREAAGASVCVLDAGEPLVRLLATGGGRCNLANATFDPRELAANYPRGGRFLRSVFARFGAREAMDWFESRGLKLAVEEEGRVFPASRRAEDVRDFFLGLAARLGVEVLGHRPVGALEAADGLFLVAAAGVELAARSLILATGGGLRKGGGVGHRLAASFGHRITPLRPALTPLRTLERWPARLAGVSVRVAAAEFHDGRRRVRAEGGLLFTHRGISGPLALRLSSLAAFLDFGPSRPLEVSLDLLPARGAAELEAGLDTLAREHPSRSLLNALPGEPPRALLEALLAEAGLEPKAAAGGLSRGARRRAIAVLKGTRLHLSGTEQGGEMVTAGGVELDEVRQSDLGSKLVDGLHFAGEILDIDGLSGGFNLQAAWSTGRLAGPAAVGRGV